MVIETVAISRPLAASAYEKAKASLMLVARRASIVCCVLAVMSGANRAAAEDETLKVSYNSDWPPYSASKDENVHGILPALVEAIIVERLKIPVRHSGAPWSRAQFYVLNGTADAMVTVATEERLEFSLAGQEVIYQFRMQPIVRKGSLADINITATPSVDTLRTLRVCDMLSNGWAQRFFGKYGIEIITAESAAGCLKLIAADRADVLVQPSAIAYKLIGDLEIENKMRVLPHVFGSMEFKILVSKKSKFGQGLLHRLDEVIAGMKADGSYEALINRLNHGVESKK